MGVWYDQHPQSKLPFIVEEKVLGEFSIGLIRSSYQVGKTHKRSESSLLAFDGEITNLEELSRDLHLEIADPIVVLESLYLHAGSEGFFQLEGSCSLVYYDHKSGKTTLYRSFLNGYPLYFVHKNNRFTASTNPVCILYRDDVDDELDQEKVVSMFAIRPLEWSGTIFRQIEEVQHGELVTISSNTIERVKQDGIKKLLSNESYENEKKSIDKYRSILSSAIEGSIKPKKRYGIMLSSGIDSTSIAYFAAKYLHSQERELVAYSWKLPGEEEDESEKIRMVCDTLGIPLRVFDGTYFGPFDDLDKPFLLPDTPFVNPFSRLNGECYRTAGSDGIDYLFNGSFADLLFVSKGNIYNDMFQERQYGILLRTLFDFLRQKGMMGIMRSIRRKLFRRSRQTNTSDFTCQWLTDESEHILTKSLKQETENKEMERFEGILSPYFSGYLGMERYLSGQYNLYREEPHRNLDLIKYSLGFPSYRVYRNGFKKYFVRESMRGLLPQQIVEQPRVGLLGGFVMKSFHRNIDNIRHVIWENVSYWNHYVRESWMEQKLIEGAKVDKKDLHVIWLCITFSQWMKATKPGGKLYEGQFKS